MSETELEASELNVVHPNFLWLVTTLIWAIENWLEIEE
jgi:hypothetical protein